MSEAIKTLRAFYASEEPAALVQTPVTSFLQTRGPEMAGAQTDKANTIISILEVAEADFSKLAAETEASEEEAEAAFNKLKQESEVTKAKKEMEVKGKENEIEQLKVSQNDLTADIETVNKELDAVMKTLATLRKECANKAMSYEERKARREAEMAGLREALEVLSADEGEALVQTRTLLMKK